MTTGPRRKWPGSKVSSGAHFGQLEAELPQRRWITGPFRRVENFDADNSPVCIIIHDNTLGDFFAFLDRSICQIEIDRIRRVIDFTRMA